MRLRPTMRIRRGPQTPVSRIHALSGFTMLLTLCASGFAASAYAGTVVVYTDAVAFLSATQTTLQATYESFSEGIHPDPVVDGNVVATRAPGGDPLYVGHPDGPGDGSTLPHLQSAGLMANGNEGIDLTLTGGIYNAVGFDTITNFGAPPVVSVFDANGNLVDSFALTQLPNTYGFLGITSDVNIARVRWFATSGEFQNTVLDNVRTGSVATVGLRAGTWAQAKLLYR